MNNLKNRLIDYFINRIYELYEVTGNLARFLFDRWNVLELRDEKSIENFLNSDEVKRVFFITPDLNIQKKYTIDELKNIGINLTHIINKDEKIYKDDKHGFIWQEQFNGMADCYTGLYKIKEPLPKDEHLMKK